MEYIEKILGAPAGSRVQITPDHILLTDGPGHQAAEAMLEAGTAPADAIRSCVTVMLDHDIPAGSFQTAFIQKHLIDFARMYGLDFIQSAGTSYHVLYRRKVNAGDVFVSCGEHNGFMGAKGAIGLTVSEEAMRALLTEGDFEVEVPHTTHIRLTGRLPEGVSGYDAALVLAASPAQGVLAYSDPKGVLSEEDRTLLCMFAYRAGAVTAYFEENWPAPDATRDLSGFRASVVRPADFPHAVPLAELGPVPVNACFIGGCAGGRIEDLRLAASILRGRRIRRELRLLIGAADNETYLQAVHEGLIHIFFACGAQVTNPGCASCQTTSIGVVGDGETLATTGCYNYAGCSGTERSRLYIASVENVARAALTGVLEVSAGAPAASAAAGSGKEV